MESNEVNSKLIKPLSITSMLCILVLVLFVRRVADGCPLGQV